MQLRLQPPCLKALNHNGLQEQQARLMFTDVVAVALLVCLETCRRLLSHGFVGKTVKPCLKLN